MTVPNYHRTRRQQLLAEAEGYLELISVLADRWPPPVEVRNRIVERALDVLSQITDTAGDRAFSLYLQGQALRTLERYDDAIRPLKESADASGNNIHVWLALGWCYKRINRLDLAIESLNEALAVDSSEAILHYNLACYWSLARNVDQVIYYLSMAFDIDSNYRDLIVDECDFDPVRSDPEFQSLISVVV